MSRNSSSLVETSPIRFVLLLIPFFIEAALGFCTMGVTDTSMCLWWTVFLMFMGFITLPLAAKLWGGFSSGGAGCTGKQKRVLRNEDALK